MIVHSEDRNILRDLAGRVRDIAAMPDQVQLRQAWQDHNALRPGRPLILTYPEGAWRELLPDESLQIADPFLRQVEKILRMQIYGHAVIRDERPVDAVFNLWVTARRTGWGLEVPLERTDALGAFHWDPPLKDIRDIKKLKPETISDIDENQARERFTILQDIFGDILAVRFRGQFWWTLGVMHDVILLRGLDRMMEDMYDNPEWLKDLVQFMCEARQAMLDKIEASGYLNLNNEGETVGSGGLGYTNELPAPGFTPGKARCRDLWGFTEAQELVGVGPEMMEEFFLQFQYPIMARFGLTCYGCCEPVHDRLALIKKVPNIRRISISPWADVRRSAEELKGGYVFSHKPNPAVLAGLAINEDHIRGMMTEVMAACKEHGCILETIMKDTHTVKNDPRRIPRWVEITKQVRAEIYGKVDGGVGRLSRKD